MSYSEDINTELRPQSYKTPEPEGFLKRLQASTSGIPSGSENDRANLWIKASAIILRYRWWFMLLSSLLYIGFELVEHLGSPHGFNVIFHLEFWLFALIVPLVGGLTLTLLAKSEKERSEAMNALALELEVNTKLNSCQSWEELYSYLIGFPLRFAPFRDVWFLLFDVGRAEFQQVAWFSEPQAGRSSLPPSWYQAKSDLLTSAGLKQLAPEDFPDLDFSAGCAAYSLPLLHGEQPVGAYLLYLPAPFRLSENHIKLLERFASSIAIAIDALHPHGSRVIQAVAVAGEQQRLSRYLHDSIAQDLGYMLLKLDQLQNDECLRDPAAVKKELAHLHEVTNKAYGDTRDTITALYPFNPGDLESVLIQRARLEPDGEHKLNITITTDGKAQPLSPFLQRGLLAIFQEALTNTRKHADASEFYVRLLWDEDRLTMSMRDNGKGYPLSPERQAKGGYGSQVMKERAREMNGHLAIDSHPDGGTVVTVQVPLGMEVTH